MSFARVEALSSELASAQAALSAVVEQFATSSGVLGEAWRGDAAATFAEAQAAWQHGAEGLAAVLTGAQRAAEAAAARHRAAEQAVVALWSDR